MSQTARIIPLYREADQSNPRSFFLKAGGIICLLFSALFMSPVNIIKTPNNKVQQSANFFLVDFVKDSFDVSPSGWYEDSLFFVADGRTHKAYEDAGRFMVESYDPVITQDTLEYDIIPNVTLDVEVVVYGPKPYVEEKEEEVEVPSWNTYTEAQRIQFKKDYIDRFHYIAQLEDSKFGIPASITLAQGILESAAGTSLLAVRDQNHFGIKCRTTKIASGCSKKYYDKLEGSNSKYTSYKNAWASFRDHSLLLTNDRYGWMVKKCGSDYKCWAKGLKKSGYATDKRYVGKLIKLIEDLELYKYDN